MAFDLHELHLNSQVKIRLEGFVPYAGWEAPEGWEPGQPALVQTSLGQVIFNQTLPEDYPWVEAVADKGELSRIVNDLAERYPKVVTAATLDNLKDAGFYWATRSGVTVAISDIEVPKDKPQILAGYETMAAKIQGQYDKGLIDDDERRQELIEIWNKATNEIAQAMRDSLSPMNTINRMVSSGARGNWMQVRQIAGIRGLVANPKGEIIPRPIKSSYREGLSVLEYFIATHGARKGLADTALRTANSGYLTRRLVDVSQDVIVREEDCGTERGLVTPIAVLTPTASWCWTRTSRTARTPVPSPWMSLTPRARSWHRRELTAATLSSPSCSRPASPRSRSAPCSPVSPASAPAPCATAVRLPRVRPWTLVRPWVSSPRSPSVSPVPS
ncbi:DNA-directed RNA polymerase subunit beta' [Arthrobacter sp. Hiyo6]|nr:DNA-directed RNA polymerase subunit beta' [Arthrobacter sp. Hiyo6]